MRLRDLDAEFVTLDGDGWRRVSTLTEAQGVMFQCPKCSSGREVVEEVIDGEVRRFVCGAHYVLCWFAGRGVPDTMDPKPGRWNPSGTGLDDLTFVGPGAASVLLTSGCGWHGFVRQGDAA